MVEDVVETEARVIMKVQGVEIDEEGGAVGAIDQTEDPTSGQYASLALQISQCHP